MSAQDILTLFYTNSENLTPLRILAVICLSLGCGAVIWCTYRFTGEATAYSHSYGISCLLMALLTTTVMLMISTNIVISLGMVGALSIVRFRTAVKDPRDTMYLFWAIVVGLSAGSQNFVLAVLSTLFISAVLCGIHLFPRRKTRFTLIVRASGLSAAQVQAAVKSPNARVKLQAMHSAATGEGEYVFTLSGSETACTELSARLTEQSGITQVNLVAPGAD